MPSARWDLPELPLLTEQEPRSPEELEALRKRAEKEVRTKLGSAIELVEIGDVVSYEFLEKELAIRERLDVMIARARSNRCHPPPCQHRLSRCWKRPHSSFSTIPRSEKVGSL
jgi:hypothetical protein